MTTVTGRVHGRPAGTTARTIDLRPATTETAIAVALSGLPPLYCHGLVAALSSAGISCHRPLAAADWTPLFELDRPLVVVVADGQAAAVAALLADRDPPLPLVHVLDELSTSTCARALRSGATGVLAVGSELTVVLDAVRAAAAGNTLLPHRLAELLCGTPAVRPPELSAREGEWLLALADACTVAGLARRAGYSEREMYRLLSALYERLGATNRTEALLLAQRYGLLDRSASRRRR